MWTIYDGSYLDTYSRSQLLGISAAIRSFDPRERVIKRCLDHELYTSNRVGLMPLIHFSHLKRGNTNQLIIVDVFMLLNIELCDIHLTKTNTFTTWFRYSITWNHSDIDLVSLSNELKEISLLWGICLSSAKTESLILTQSISWSKWELTLSWVMFWTGAKSFGSHTNGFTARN